MSYSKVPLIVDVVMMCYTIRSAASGLVLPCTLVVSFPAGYMVFLLVAHCYYWSLVVTPGCMSVTAGSSRFVLALQTLEKGTKEEIVMEESIAFPQRTADMNTLLFRGNQSKETTSASVYPDDHVADLLYYGCCKGIYGMQSKARSSGTTSNDFASSDSSAEVVPKVVLAGYVVSTGKDNFIVSTGRSNMVPAGRTIVSPGSIILGPDEHIALRVKARCISPRVRQDSEDSSQLNQFKAKPDDEDTILISQSSKARSHSSGNVLQDVLHSLVAESEPEQQVAYEDFEQIDKLDLEEMDIKWQMAMLSVRVNKFEKKAGRKIEFDKKEAARFNKKAVRCYKCLQKGHFARECRAKGGNEKRYSSFKIQELGKRRLIPKALITLHIGKTSEVQNRINVEAEIAKKDLQTKLDNHLAKTEKWTSSSKNLFRLIDSSMSVRTKVGLGFDNIYGKGELGWDCSELVNLYPNDKSSKIKSNDYAFCVSSVKSSEPMTADSSSNASTSSEFYQSFPLEPIWDNATRVTQSNQFVPQAVRLRSGKVSIPAARPNQVSLLLGQKQLLTVNLHTDPEMREYVDRVVVSAVDWQQGKINFNNSTLFSVSQICDKKNRVLFTDTDCLILSNDFKLPDKSMVLLRVPRKHNLYTFNLNKSCSQGRNLAFWWPKLLLMKL
ncbi:ribonuclease H-like domain-containing protein [Tanacetum coccineum]